MRLDLPVPRGWRIDGRSARAPDGVPATLAWSALTLAPTSTEETAVTGLVQLGQETTRTRDGWPVILVDAWRPDTGEMRLAAFFAFRGFVADAVLHVRDRDLYFGVRQEVLPSLLAARPNFGGALACLAQFWSDDDLPEDAR